MGLRARSGLVTGRPAHPVATATVRARLAGRPPETLDAREGSLPCVPSGHFTEYRLWDMPRRHGCATCSPA
jgi:hypothetical protein